MELFLVVSSRSKTYSVLTGSYPTKQYCLAPTILGYLLSVAREKIEIIINEIKKYNAITFFVTSLARCVLKL